MKKNCLMGLCFANSLLLSACAEPLNEAWLEQKYSDATSRFSSMDGNRVHYRDEGAGEVIVLLHGTASSLHTWDKWTASLRPNYRVIRMDLPGFGLTGPDWADRYEVEDDVQFLSTFLEMVEAENVHLVGSSLGGRIAWQFALDHPQKVKTLTLISALGYPQESWPLPIELAQWPIFDTLMANFSPRFMYSFGLKEVYFDETAIDEALVDRYYEMSRYPGNLEAFPKRVKARLDEDASLISEIGVPTLVLWGEEDKHFSAKNALRFHSDIENSTVHIYPGVAHLPMEEIPRISVSHFVEFIEAHPVDSAVEYEVGQLQESVEL